MEKIIELFRTLFSKLPGRQNFIFWIIVAFFFKSMFSYYKLEVEENRYPNGHYTHALAAEAVDTYSYFDPMENFIQKGVYTDKQYEDYRMPGYGWVYYFLRLFFSINTTVNVIIFLQLFLSAVSVYVLALTAFMVFKRERYFYLTFFLYAVSTFVSIYDHVLLTESFCASSFIFSVYFLVKGQKNPRYLILSGLFLTWSTFLRPVMSLVFILFVLYILIKYIRSYSKVQVMKFVLMFLLPFLIIDGAWVYRNYKLYNEIIPLTKHRFYSSTEFTYLGHLNYILQAYGGSVALWEPDADIQFFRPKKDFNIKTDVVPPKYIYTSQFNYDSLLIVRSLIADMQDEKLDSAKHKAEEQELIYRMDKYTKSIQDEKPFLFYIWARVRFFKTFLIHSGTHNLFYKGSSELNKIELLAKVFYSFLYVLVLIGGFAGSFYLFYLGLKNTDYLLMGTIGLYFAFVTPVVVRMDQIRYFVPGYPFFVIALIFCLLSILSMITKRSEA